jgi:uncharacterized phiE125 gp8 family phage protein
MLEVVTPAATFDLTTVEAVNAELGLDTGENDALIAGYVASASDQIARYCKRVLVAQEYAETFYTNTYRNELLLSEYPVSEIASIDENGVPLDEDAFRVNADTGAVIRRRNGDIAWWPDASTIIIDYLAGYDNNTGGAPDLPPAIERAAILLSAMGYRARGRDPAVRTVQHGDSSVSFGFGPVATDASGLAPELIALLRPHKDFRVK